MLFSGDSYLLVETISGDYKYLVDYYYKSWKLLQEFCLSILFKYFSKRSRFDPHVRNFATKKKSLVFRTLFKGFGCKKIAAQEFRVWSPTTLLGLALSSLTTVDRTGNGAFC